MRCILYSAVSSQLRNRNRNRNLKLSKALLKSQAHQGTSLFTSAATNQRGFQRGSREAQVRFPEYQKGTATQSALELGPSHCPNGRLGQDLGFGGFAFALKLP